MINFYKRKRQPDVAMQISLSDIREINAKGKRLVLMYDGCLTTKQREKITDDFESCMTGDSKKPIILDGGFKIAVIDI